MAEVKWIKVTADIFENRKIRQIEALPDGDAVIVIWLKLLCLAGQINDQGAIYFTQEIPYTEEMMATQFNRPIQTIKMALQVFQQFGMIEIESDILKISNWEKYQNTDGLERIREQNRIRKQRQRERERQALPEHNSVTGHVTVTQSHATDKEEEEEKELEIELEKEIEIEKEREEKKENERASATAKANRTPKHKHGEYNNVLLTDEELEKIKNEYPDWQRRIENLSNYIASTGKSYKSHYATIRNWARRDQAQQQAKRTPGGNNRTAEQLDDAYKMMADWAEE